MDITQFIEKHGKPAFIDLLNIIQINDWKQPTGGWRMYCIRHGIITQRTKTVHCIWGSKKNQYYYYKGSEYRRWDEPQVQYATVLKNGSSKIVLECRFTQEQLDEWRQTQ